MGSQWRKYLWELAPVVSLAPTQMRTGLISPTERKENEFKIASPSEITACFLLPRASIAWQLMPNLGKRLKRRLEFLERQARTLRAVISLGIPQSTRLWEYISQNEHIPEVQQPAPSPRSLVENQSIPPMQQQQDRYSYTQPFGGCLTQGGGRGELNTGYAVPTSSALLSNTQCDRSTALEYDDVLSHYVGYQEPSAMQNPSRFGYGDWPYRSPTSLSQLVHPRFQPKLSIPDHIN